MNDEELKKLWQDQPLRKQEMSPEQLIPAMQSKTAALRRCLKRRDFGELAACGLIIIIFGIFYFTVYRTPVSRLGDLIIIGGAIFIACKILFFGRTMTQPPANATLVESLRADLKLARAQSKLLRSILWWYLLPLGFGLALCTWGSPVGLVIKICYSIFILALYAFIYWLNQRARVTQFLPLEAQLKTLLHSAETGEPVDQTHVENLRPIVLSMEATGKVEPVEFKAAFWQLAVYGEIGFIGIWFFLMPGLSNGRSGWTSAEQERKGIAPIYQFTQTNSYSAVAKELIEAVDAGNYAAAQMMFNPAMSRALPPREASEFFAKIKTGFGNIVKVEGPAGEGYQGWTAFKVKCERGNMIMSLALDDENKISGVYFKPAASGSGNFQFSFAPIFSWRNLLLLPLFILAGLGYTWIIQRTTNRAVGISALGVHLQRGQILILWDEIKEVRVSRALNFRNLWLIRESGEKALMQWTPLERHADLRAAVETRAPANHPIRKFLPLLK